MQELHLDAGLHPNNPRLAPLFTFFWHRAIHPSDCLQQVVLGEGLVEIENTYNRRIETSQILVDDNYHRQFIGTCGFELFDPVFFGRELISQVIERTGFVFCSRDSIATRGPINLVR